MAALLEIDGLSKDYHHRTDWLKKTRDSCGETGLVLIGCG